MFNCLCKTQVVCVNLMQKVVELFSESHIQNIVTVVYNGHCEVLWDSEIYEGNY